MIESRSRFPAHAARELARGPLLAIAILLAVTIAVFWSSIAALAVLWSHPERRTYQHGYLIAAIALWLLYRERERVADAVGVAAPAMLFLAAAGGFAWAVAWNAGLQVIHMLLWPAVFWAAAGGVLGLRAARVLLLPVAFLYFAMPIWDALTPVLQAATVIANQALAAVIGIPVLIQDTYIHIPEGTFEIAGGCSGLNYLIVGLAIAALQGEINRDRPGRRLLLIAIGGGLALISNWLRVFIIIYAGHVSDMTHYLVRVDHYNFGWFLYAFVLLLFFYVARKLPESPPQTVARAAAGDGPYRPRFLFTTVALAVIALGPLLTINGRHIDAGAGTPEGPVGVGHLELEAASGWRPSAAIEGWLPVFPGADAESLAQYAHGGDRVTVYTATFLRQAQGRELIGHDSRIDGFDRGHLSISAAPVDIATPGIQAIEAEWRSPSGTRALLWWTYRVGSRNFSTGLPAQLWYGLASLWSRPVSAIVALRAECRPDCDRARLSLRQFATAAMPELLTAASRTGDRLE